MAAPQNIVSAETLPSTSTDNIDVTVNTSGGKSKAPAMQYLNVY